MSEKMQVIVAELAQARQELQLLEQLVWSKKTQLETLLTELCEEQALDNIMGNL